MKPNLNKTSFDYYCLQNQGLFPEEFKSIPDIPKQLWLWGDSSCLKMRPRIAIVGTRRASRYALEITKRIVNELKCIHPVIVSGLAMGIDAIAHEAALEDKLKTIGILGCAIDQIYPRCNQKLFLQMRKEGLILSEHGPNSMIQKSNFSYRNRLIAALADIIIVTEAPVKSGALITARFGASIGKETYVVPGSILHDRNWGGYKLVNDGAKIYFEPKQIFQDLKIYLKNILPKKNAINSPSKDDLIIHYLIEEPVHVDKLLTMGLKPPDQMLMWLTEKTISGQIKELPGKYFIATEF